MDRARLNYSTFLARKLAGLRSETGEIRGPISEATERKQQAKAVLSSYGPAVIYNGTEVENSVVLRTVAKPETIMPKEKVHILEGAIKRTTDQIKLFSLPEALHVAGKEIGIISHDPQLARITRMLNRYKTIPPDMTVRLFPLPTPPEGKEEYATMEIKGLLYYVFLSPDHDAAKEPYPHIVHGEKSAD